MLLILLAAVPLEVMKTAPLWLDREGATDEQALIAVWEHLQGMAFVLFLMLLLTHGWAARVYRAALTTALREGRLEPADLGPRLYLILKRLELLPEPAEAKRGLARMLRWTWRWYAHRFLFAAMLLLGFLFVVKVYVGEAFVTHPFVGFMNHPLLQFPCVDYVPRRLLH